MRRGPFAKGFSSRKVILEDNAPKTHDYGVSVRPIAVKRPFSGENYIPQNSVLLNVRNTQSGYRQKRETRDKESRDKQLEDKKTHDELTAEKRPFLQDIDRVNKLDSFMDSPTEIEESEPTINQTEGHEVEGTISFHIAENNTDQRLFAHDVVAVQSSQLQNEQSKVMRKTIVDDTMNLYPVYSGVNYHYPLNQRKYRHRQRIIELPNLYNVMVQLKYVLFINIVCLNRNTVALLKMARLKFRKFILLFEVLVSKHRVIIEIISKTRYLVNEYRFSVNFNCLQFKV